MKRYFFAISCMLFSLAGITGGFAQTGIAESLKHDVFFLASDSLQGRKPGTSGDKAAAAYIRQRFMEEGLTPSGSHGFQYFDVVTDIKAGTRNRLRGAGIEGIPGTDFNPVSFSSNATAEAEVIFAGYGFDIDSDSIRWDDYANTDVAGKWVMLLRGHPEQGGSRSAFAPFSSDRAKALLAKDKGAAGVLLVTGAQWEKRAGLLSISYDKSIAGAGIPVVNITRAFADSLFREGSQSIAGLEREINSRRQALSFNTRVQLTGTTDLELITARTQNVIAVLEGADPVLKHEYIVVGAHYDHLGMGGPGSGSRMPDTLAVHYGADDNASGTSMLMALARIMQEYKPDLWRSIVFVAFGAEEMGLLGSSEFISQPLFDLTKITAMINFDMVGRLNPENPVLSVGGTGTAAEFNAMLDRHVQNRSFTAGYSAEGYGPSDHAVFYAQDIPVLYFSTGVHGDYHTPDDRPEKINMHGAEEVARFVADIIAELAGGSVRLTFTEAGPKERNPHGYGLQVKLGIMPDFTDTSAKGLRIGGVTKGAPAYNGGLLRGDIITALDGKTVENIYDYMERLKAFSPGQTISVDILRGTEAIVFLIQL